MAGDAVKYPESAPHTEGEGWSAVVRAVDSLRDEISQRHVENTTVNEEQSLKLDEVIRRVDALHKGFPNNDPDGHRKAHEVMIARAEARTELYKALRTDLLTKGLWAVVATIGVLVIRYLNGHIKIL